MNLVLLFIGVVLTLLYCVIYLKNAEKYEAWVAGVDDEVYSLKDVLVVGFAVVEMLKLNTRNVNEKKRRKLTELYTAQYTEFYCIVDRAAVISYMMTFLPFAFLIGALMNSIAGTLLVGLLAVFMPIYTNMRIDDQIKTRREELLLDYPTVLSKMALMVNAGMMLREAWALVAESGSRKLYVEMRRASASIANGESEIRAYEDFGAACKINELKKFASIICQNVEKGNSELVQVMKQLSMEAWTTKKNIAISRGKNAETKLIIPVGITFVGVLAMILVPIVTNMSM